MNAKNVKNLSVLILSAFLVLTACKPDPPSTKTKTDLITAAPWKFSQAGIDQNGDGTIDFPLPGALLQACATDNILTFNKDQSGTVDEGATKCSTTTPQMVPFNWKFLSNETELDFSTTIFAGLGGTVKLVQLTEEKMAISKPVPITGFPIPVVVTVILVH
ncbi:MAG: hypothetical protein WKF97_09965 [Chitinophagaceae bacterium]